MEEAVKNFFSPQGPLSASLNNYEERHAQTEMALLVLDTFRNGEISVIEAGTGIGKTLAYLVPALILKKKTIISTATKNLQDQILKKDLPFLKENFFPHVKYIALKGRQNYLCKRQLMRFNLQGGVRSPEDILLVKKIMSWARNTSTGDLTEIGEPNSHPLFWTLAALPERCHGRNCEFFHSCYITEARNRAARSDLIVVNHHLLCADLMLKNRNLADIIPEADALVIDEAHHFPEVIRHVYGLRYSSWNWRQLHSEIKTLDIESIKAGLLDEKISRVEELHKEIIQALQQFSRTEYQKSYSSDFSESLRSLNRKSLEEIFAKSNEVAGYFQELATSYGSLKSLFDNASDENLAHIRERICEYRTVIEEICSLADENYIYWAEWDDNFFTINSVPVSPEEAVRSTFSVYYPCVVMTSATLATAKNNKWSFDFFLENLGLPSSTPCYNFPSPYDYKRQMVLFLPSSPFPLPSDPGFPEVLAEIACEILNLSSGRALFLFTNYRNMKRTGTLLRERLDYPILIQGEKSRSELLTEFRENVSSILVATKSFWEGIDVPGESLTVLLIEKLPFPTPDDPLIQGEQSYFRKKGKNYFMDIQVPRTILTLRQGIGRLIRSGKDVGIVAIFDVRIRTASYGRLFLESLPPCTIVDSLEALKKQWEMIKGGKEH